MAVNQTVRLGARCSASKISYVDIFVWERENGREEERNGKRKLNATILLPSSWGGGNAGGKSFREIARLTRHRFQFSSFSTRTTINDECTETLLFSPLTNEFTKKTKEINLQLNFYIFENFLNLISPSVGGGKKIGK